MVFIVKTLEYVIFSINRTIIIYNKVKSTNYLLKTNHYGCKESIRRLEASISE